MDTLEFTYKVHTTESREAFTGQLECLFVYLKGGEEEKMFAKLNPTL
jgi:hypothetical protein